MSFASLQYLVFLPVVVGLYWSAPRRYRNLLLLISSYVFYMSFFPPYGVLIFGLAIANYLIGVGIAGSRRPGLVLAVGVTFDLAVLGFFKYTNFFIGSLGNVFGEVDWPTLNVILPLGISFFTFEFVHYLIDIRRGSVPIHNFTNFHLFASFFPSQIAGPIKRFQPFNTQLRLRPRFDLTLFEGGLWLIVRGYVKKVVFADHLAPLVTSAFAHGALPTSGSAWIGVYAFALQIFFDFSGYTDIGRGSAQLMGFTLPENFLQPYFAVGFRDFWRRWHMSLSSWLRDYLYIPLGGNRRGRGRTWVNLLLTMTLGGLWHGASLHFAVWGLFHGVGLVAERGLGSIGAVSTMMTRLVASAPGRALVAVGTFQIVCVGWVFFRAPDLAAAGHYLAAMAGRGGTVEIPSGPVSFVLAAYGGGVLIERLVPGAFGPQLDPRLWVVRGFAYAVLASATAILVPQTIERFIYFQF